MNIFQVALELEGSGKLTVTVLADSMTIHLTILLIELYVVFHMIHESDIVFQSLGTMWASEGRCDLRKACELGHFATVPSIVEVVH